MLGVEDGQRPAPAGQLAGDRGVGDRRAFLTLVETHPAGVQPVIGAMPAGLCRLRGSAPALTIAAGPMRCAVMPGLIRPAADGHVRCRSW